MAVQNDILPIGQNYYIKLIFKEKFQYNPLNIISITTREYVFERLPKIELVLKYDHTIFENAPIEDNDIFSVTIAKSTADPNPITMDFMVHDWKMNVLGDDRANVIQITGIFKCKNMFQLQTKSYHKKTSKDVCIDVAMNCGLNLVIGSETAKISDIYPNDSMTWYQLNQSNYDFLKHVLKRSYVHDDCVMLYGDHNGDLIYTTINTEIDKKAPAKIAKFDVENFAKWIPDDNDNTIWYNSYEIINLCGSFNKESGYGVKSEYYDLTESKDYTYKKFKKMADMALVDSTYFGQPVFNIYGGMFNNKNVYDEKYFESIVRNYYLKNNLLSFCIELNINSVSDVNLFDKINLSLNSKLAQGSNRIMSGEYLVVGIIFFVAMNGIYQKRLYLSRNGMNFPEWEGFLPISSNEVNSLGGWVGVE